MGASATGEAYYLRSAGPFIFMRAWAYCWMAGPKGRRTLTAALFLAS